MSLSASQWPLSQRLPFKCQNVHPCRMAIIFLLPTFAFQRVSVRCQKKAAHQTSCANVLGISSNVPRTCVPQPDANSQQLKQTSQAFTPSETDEQDAKYTMKWVRCLSRHSMSDVCALWQPSGMFPSLKSSSIFDPLQLKNSSCGSDSDRIQVNVRFNVNWMNLSKACLGVYIYTHTFSWHYFHGN